MGGLTFSRRLLGYYLLREIRGYIVRSHAVMMTVFIGIVYALLSMSQSGMLVFARLNGGYTLLLVTGNGTGYQPWNYPGLLLLAPWGIVDLPLFGLLSMIVVTVGVALGMSVAVLLGVALVRRRSAGAASGPGAVGALTGLTPAMIALLALGACCSTTAAATAGVSVIAAVSGTTTSNLLVNNWYLGVFQMAIVWVALVAQEALLRTYGRLFGLPVAPSEPLRTVPTPRLDRDALLGAGLRAALLVGGVAWSLAILVDWTTTSPSTASAADWFGWLVLHQAVAAVAVASALFPREILRWWADPARPPGATVARALAAFSGALLVFGVPLSGAGPAHGWGNELLAVVAGPHVWGASSPHLTGVALAFRWAVEYALLGGFALAAGLVPSAALRWPCASAGAGPSDAPGDPAQDGSPVGPSIVSN